MNLDHFTDRIIARVDDLLQNSTREAASPMDISHSRGFELRSADTDSPRGRLLESGETGARIRTGSQSHNDEGPGMPYKTAGFPVKGVQMSKPICDTCQEEICRHGICECNGGECEDCWKECQARLDAEREARWQVEVVVGPLMGFSQADHAEDNYHYLGARYAELEARRNRQLQIAICLAGALVVLGGITLLKSLGIL